MRQIEHGVKTESRVPWPAFTRKPARGFQIRKTNTVVAFKLLSERHGDADIFWVVGRVSIVAEGVHELARSQGEAPVTHFVF